MSRQMIAGFPSLRHPRKKLGDGGSVAVEFAVLLPVLFVLVVCSIDYAQMVNSQAALEGATRAGAEYALSNPTDSSGIESQVTGYQNFSPAPTANVSAFCTCSDNANVTCPTKGAADPCPASKGQTDTRVFQYVAVEVTQTFQPTLGGSSTLGAQTVVRIR